MENSVKFSSKVSKRNRTGFVIGVPKNTIEANPQIKHGSSVNVTLEVKD